jgi:hypothetical protein
VAVSPLLAREPESPPLVAGAGAAVDLELLAHATAEGFAFLRYGLPVTSRQSARTST